MRRVAILLLLAGCGGGGSSVTEPPVTPPPPEQPPPPTPPPVVPGIAASVAFIDGVNQTVEVTKELPQAIVIRVTDARSLAVPSQLVNFVVVSGGGSVFAGSAQTNALGEAGERWTLGTVAGEQTLEARAVDPTTREPIVFARVTATATPGAAVLLGVHPIDSVRQAQTGDGRSYVGDTLRVRDYLFAAWDQYGNNIQPSSLTLGAAVTGDIEPRGETFVLDHPFQGYIYFWANGDKLQYTPYGWGKQSWEGMRLDVYNR